MDAPGTYTIVPSGTPAKVEPLAEGGVVARQMMESTALHSARQYEPSELIVDGKSIPISEVQPLNAYMPSDVTPSGMFTDASAEQFSKVELPGSEVTVLGKTTEVSMLHPLNACEAMMVIPDATVYSPVKSELRQTNAWLLYTGEVMVVVPPNGELSPKVVTLSGKVNVCRAGQL